MKQKHKGMDLKERVVQHPGSANKDTKPQRGKWFNFLKVKPYGTGKNGVLIPPAQGRLGNVAPFCQGF